MIIYTSVHTMEGVRAWYQTNLRQKPGRIKKEVSFGSVDGLVRS